MAGESVVIAEVGRPVGTIVPLDEVPAGQEKRTGFLRNIHFPDDFDRMAETEIAAAFPGLE